MQDENHQINNDEKKNHDSSEVKKIVFPKRDPRLIVRLTEGLKAPKKEKVTSD